MQVILLEDVKGTGKKGQVINVSDGHAKNFLIPKKLAAEATKSTLNDWEKKKKTEENKRQNEVTAAQELAARIEKTSVKITMKVGENGKMFGSVGNKEIAAALSSQFGIQIDRKKIVLDEQIKTIGEKIIPIRLYSEITAKLNLEIVAE
ncbi:MAG: 50S ribosomal protein L9 [Firmicutes bacterium]|nr:50S ribosomal protein L9 [Bacillota bacterium]